MSESSETYLTLEEKIDKLKTKAETYDKLTDNEKIQNFEEYNQMLVEQNEYNALLMNYKNVLSNDNKKKKNVTCDDKAFGILMTQVHEIKQKMDENNISLDELMELYGTLNDAKIKIDVYLNNKKISIKNI
jgi:hypothetical protein